jgi:FlgD Ig-like domain
LVKPATRGKRGTYRSGYPQAEYALGPNWPEIESRHSRAKATIIVAIMLAAGLVLLLGGVLVATHVRHHSALAGSSLTVPLVGSSVSNQANLAQETGEFGHMPIVRVYYPGLPGADAWTTGIAGANDSAVVVSFKALPQTILSGADDAALEHFFDTAPHNRPIYYSYYHEPEDNIAAGQFTLADYKAAWARVVGLADAARNPDLHSTLILMEWDLQAASGRDWESYLPGGGIISTLGWDAYPAGSVGGKDPKPVPPADFFGPAIAASRSVGLPFGFAEFGLATAAGRPAWLTEVGDYLMNSGAVFATLFNTSTAVPAMHLTDAASETVWRGFVADSNEQIDPSPSSSPTAMPSPVSSATGKPTPTPTPVSSATGKPTPTPPPAQAPPGPGVSGLSVSPPEFAVGNANRTLISMTLAHAATVTVSIVNQDGKVVRQLSRPNRAAGRVTVPYYGFDGHGNREPPGQYQILVVARDAQGSSTAKSTLTITSS